MAKKDNKDLEVQSQDKNKLDQIHQANMLLTRREAAIREKNVLLETLISIPQDSVEDKERIKAKSETLIKTMLLAGLAGKITTKGITKDGTKFEAVSLDNQCPNLYELFSGSLGRTYIGFPKIKKEDILKYLGSEVKPRNAATHSAKIIDLDEPQVIEKKGLKYGLKGILSSILRKMGLTKSKGEHFGMNLPIGGYGSQNKLNNIIKDDGRSGHLYYNLKSQGKSSVLGFGLEGTAPSKKGSYGAHSAVGNADVLSASGGPKLMIATKYSKNIETFLLAYIAAHKQEIEANPGKKSAAEALIDHCKGKTKQKSAEFKKLISQIGLIHHPYKPYVITPAGQNYLDNGLVLRDPYNGRNINSSRIKDMQIFQEAYNTLGFKADDQSFKKEVINEFLYYKAIGDPEKFLAQEMVYKDIEKKPALSENPHFDPKTSLVIGTIYNLSKSTENDVLNKSVNALTVFQGDKFNKLCDFLAVGDETIKGININNFNTDQIIKIKLALISNKEKFPADLNVAKEDLEGLVNIMDKINNRFIGLPTKQEYQDFKPQIKKEDGLDTIIEVINNRSHVMHLNRSRSTQAGPSLQH